MHRLSSYVVGSNLSAPVRPTYERYMNHREANRGNCRLGSLTHKGVMQHTHNGEMFRKLYIDTAKLLPEAWNDDVIYVRSGDQLRLIESAQALLNGLYPPNENSPHQKQQFDLLDDAFDNMSPHILDVCPRGMKMKSEALKRPAWVNHSAASRALESQLKEIFQATVSVNGLADLIRTYACHNFDITFGGLLTNDQIHKVLEMSLFCFTYFPNDTASNRLGMGSFIGEITHHFQSHIEGKTPYKLMLYSGHDSSIAPLLSALELFDGAWPPLASHVIFEFWKNGEGEYFVEVSYNGRSLTRFKKGCEGQALCPWHQFLKSVSKVSVGLDHFWKECNDVTTPLSKE